MYDACLYDACKKWGQTNERTDGKLNSRSRIVQFFRPSGSSDKVFGKNQNFPLVLDIKLHLKTPLNYQLQINPPLPYLDARCSNQKSQINEVNPAHHWTDFSLVCSVYIRSKRMPTK